MPNEVFISYSRRDEDFIKQLYQALIDRGISTWYDRENIRVGNQWATEIVEGIRDCQVFVLALSPDSAASPNVRKEVDLAQRYNKQIVPLIWRTTEIPVAMEYQLAGIQWIEFNETASAENFNQLVGVIQRLMGGSSMVEATTDTQIAKESSIPPIEADEAPAKPEGKKSRRRERRLTGRKAKQAVAPLGIGAAVISSVVTTLGLDIDEQDVVNGELKWLFSAADNFMKVRSGDIEPDQPIKVPIPEDAEVEDEANNQLLMTDEFELGILEGELTTRLTVISKHLRNLNMQIEIEAEKGPAGHEDIQLQNNIKSGRREIVNRVNEIAQGMNQAYGVLVTAPEELLDLL